MSLFLTKVTHEADVALQQAIDDVVFRVGDQVIERHGEVGNVRECAASVLQETTVSVGVHKGLRLVKTNTGAIFEQLTGMGRDALGFKSHEYRSIRKPGKHKPITAQEDWEVGP